MKPRNLEYSHVFNLGDYETERITLTADLDETEDLDEAFRTIKAQVFHLHEEGKLLEESKKVVESEKPSEESRYDEQDFESLFWETKEGSKGPYQQTSKRANNNSRLFQDLQKILKEHNGFVQLGDFRFWNHQNDPDVIDRRRKRPPNAPQDLWALSILGWILFKRQS